MELIRFQGRAARPAAAVTGLGLMLTLLSAPPAAATAGGCAAQPVLGSRSVDVIEVDGCRFKDLDGDGALTPYEDWRLSPAQRAADLVGRMSLEQKTGLLVHGTLPAVGSPTVGRGTEYDLAALAPTLSEQHVTTYITRLSTDAAAMAEQTNRVQEAAEAQPLGVPVLISSDPRNGFTVVEGQTVASASFTTFPDAIGFGAIGDPEVTEQYADIARQEYRAVGILEGLSPQADLATEPRWNRTNGTFGSEPEEVAEHVAAYIRGMQAGGEGLGSSSVATVVKHWVGYGAQLDGRDSHYYYGRYATFPGGAFDQHLLPYDGAFAENASGIMPTYSILQDLVLDGRPVEQVGAGFNEFLLQDLLRSERGFDGVIVSDWGITGDCDEECKQRDLHTGFIGPDGTYGMPWGVEDLARVERFAKAINAGIDQVGGLNEPTFIVDAVHQGLLTEARIDESALRVLTQKFELGLFENPYTDPAQAAQVVGNPDFQAAAIDAQHRSLTLLQNDGDLLPLSGERTAWLHGVSAEAAQRHGLTVVDDPAEADIAVIRLTDPKSGPDLMGLDWTGTEPDAQALERAAAAGIPTVVSANLQRPLILTDVLPQADAVFGDYGIGDDALLDVITGSAGPGGLLPFELPSSMTAVEVQYEDLPNDSTHPLFPVGFGLSYGEE